MPTFKDKPLITSSGHDIHEEKFKIKYSDIPIDIPMALEEPSNENTETKDYFEWPPESLLDIQYDDRKLFWLGSQNPESLKGLFSVPTKLTREYILGNR